MNRMMNGLGSANENIFDVEIPACAGEIILGIVNSITGLFHQSSMSQKTISTQLSQTSKSLTNSSDSTVYFVESNFLIAANQDPIPINPSSFHGLITTNKTPQIINQAFKSSLLKSFELNHWPASFSNPSSLLSVCSVPILNESNDVVMVVFLYNKQDHRKKPTNFSLNDVYLVQAAGQLVLEILNMQKKLFCVNEELKRSLKIYKETTYLQSTSSGLVRREKCFEFFVRNVKTINEKTMELMAIAVGASAVLLHVKQGDELRTTATFGVGVKVESTQTSEHVANVVRDTWIVHDLNAEPLWSQKLMGFRSLMACPIISPKYVLMGVVEFLRADSSFTEHDKRIVKDITDVLSSIPHQNYLKLITKTSSEPSLEKVFNFSSIKILDCQVLSDQVRNSIAMLVPNENCFFHIVNQTTQEHLTVSSGFIQTLHLTNDTLVGYSYFNKKAALLSPGSNLPIKELQNYKNKHLMVVPIINTWFDYSVIGVIQLCRSQPFSNSDLDVVEKLANTLSCILEDFFVIVENPSKPVWASEDAVIPQVSLEVSPKPSPALQFLYQIDSLSTEKLVKISNMRKILENTENPLMSFATEISKVLNCQAGGLLLKNITEDYCLYLPKGNLISIGGLIQQCFLTNSTIYVKKNPEDVPEFDPRVDCLELSEKIENILCVPVPGYNDEVLGVICLLNSSSRFNIEDIVLVQYFAVIIRELINRKNPETKVNQVILQETRKNKILLRWFKQVFVVSNSLKSKHELVKEVYQKLLADSSPDTLVSYLLQITKAITNSEHVFAVLHKDDSLTKYTTNSAPQSEDMSGEILEYIQTPTSLILSKHKGKENLFIYPYGKIPKKLVIVLSNKKDETLSYYCLYTRAEEAMVSELAQTIFNALAAPSKQTTSELKLATRKFAAGMNTTSLINTIRSGAQQLLECDRATVFIRENDNLVVKAQGIEHEIPVGIKVPISKGIVGFVAQTGQKENIQDVYSDPRFNKDIDLMTGFRTRSMLCMPVFDVNNQVIAALQMINKRSGVFNENDEENLELFAEMSSSVLQNWIMMEKIIEERGVYLNILNSIGNYVMVLNSEGRLQYFNKQITKIFETFEQTAQSTHYSSWLRFNRQLVIDITTVFQNPDKKISRSGQRVSTQILPNTFPGIVYVESSNVFNYSVCSLNDSFSSTAAGLIVILEDASAIQELNVKFNAMQNQLIKLTNPVQTETSLQRCINQLQVVQTSLDQDSQISNLIQDIIDTLRQGNLHKTELFIPIELKSMEKELKSRLSLYIEENTLRPRERHRLSIRALGSEFYAEDLEMTALGSWNLDAFEVIDHFKYIRLMFSKFSLFSEFQIMPEIFQQFLQKVRQNYLNNPFHNFYHGFTVMHSAYYLLNLKKINEIFNNQEILAVLVAALCHDLGHRGFTNLYEVNILSDLAIRYNDISVLENHHTALTFQLINESESNIFKNISKDTTRYIRKIIIESILSTDMMKHFPIIGSHTDRFRQSTESPIGSLELDCLHLSGFIVHCCDIGHPTKTLDLFQKWSKLVCKEFSKQYMEEITNSLPPTEFMRGLDTPLSYYKNEVGFLSVIVKPLWECFSLWAGSEIEECMKNLYSNLKMYQEKQELSQQAIR